MFGNRKATTISRNLADFTDFSSDWRSVPLNSDSALDAFISGNWRYTHALNFGQSVVTSVNGVNFAPVIPNQSDSKLIVTAPQTINPSNLNGGVSRGPKADTLCDCFLFGAPYSLSLLDLVPKTPYRVSFYHYPWDASPSGLIQSVTEKQTSRSTVFDRAQYLIYYLDIFLNQTNVSFNFANSSHLFALTCQHL
jgi:hypothetical protein